MQEDKLYEYAVIRLVPKVEREEFFNIGLLMFSKKENYLRIAFHVCPDKFQLMYHTLEYREIQEHLDRFRNIATGASDGGPIAQLGVPERFRWLTATRSTVVQSSKIHPGFCDDLDLALEKLFVQLVG